MHNPTLLSLVPGVGETLRECCVFGAVLFGPLWTLYERAVFVSLSLRLCGCCVSVDAGDRWIVTTTTMTADMTSSVHSKRPSRI